MEGEFITAVGKWNKNKDTTQAGWPCIANETQIFKISGNI